jgi:hypothetical protein
MRKMYQILKNRKKGTVILLSLWKWQKIMLLFIFSLLSQTYLYSQKIKFHDKSYRDSISKTKYKDYNDKIYVAYENVSFSRNAYLMDNTVKVPFNADIQEGSSFATMATSHGFDFGYWKLSFGFSSTTSDFYIVQDGQYFFSRKAYNFSFPIKKLYFTPSYSSDRYSVKDSLENNVRSLKYDSYQVSTKIVLYNTGYIDMFYTSNYSQIKNAFAIRGFIVPFYNTISGVNKTDSILTYVNTPFWGSKIDLSSISMYGLELALSPAINLVYKRFFFGTSFELKLLMNYSQTKYRDLMDEKSMFNLNFPWSFIYGFGFNWDRFYIKASLKLVNRKIGFDEFYFKEFYYHGNFTVGIRFRANEKMNNFRKKIFGS